MVLRQRKTSNLWEFPIPAHTNNMLSLSRIHVTPFTPKTPLLRQSKQWLSSHMLSSPYRSSPHSHHESCHKATVLFISRRSWRGTPASSWWVCGGASVLRRHVWRSMRGGGKKGRWTTWLEEEKEIRGRSGGAQPVWAARISTSFELDVVTFDFAALVLFAEWTN